MVETYDSLVGMTDSLTVLSKANKKLELFEKRLQKPSDQELATTTL